MRESNYALEILKAERERVYESLIQWQNQLAFHRCVIRSDSNYIWQNSDGERERLIEEMCDKQYKRVCQLDSAIEAIEHPELLEV